MTHKYHKPMSVYEYRKAGELLRFIDHTDLKMEEALALQRKHFTGLGTDKPVMLKPRKQPLTGSAATFVIRRLALEGDPEDYVLPRYLFCPPPPEPIDLKASSPLQAAAERLAQRCR
ncbi:MAG: hypothetical protein NTAFB05_20930 [Nitrobacter sp.]|uniref:hypothetical protein n=1 Tax=Nitrobacter sp. TaxID=29420 RepID=UPI00387DE04E